MLKLKRLDYLAPASLFVLLMVSHSASAALVATYQFNNNFAADQPAAPLLTPLNAGTFVMDTVFGQTRTVYNRYSNSNAPSSQSVLQLDTTSLGLTANNYAVELVYNFTDNLNGTSWRRILNSYDPTSQSDNGFYVSPSQYQLDIFDASTHPGGQQLVDGSYYDVVLNVSASEEQAFVNGSLAVDYTFSGTGPDAIRTHYLSFFLDNSSEYGNGRLALLRIFNNTLSSAEVASLYNNGNPFTSANNVYEPGTFALLMAGLATLRRRRQ